VVPGLGAEAGAALSAHTGVQHVSFTGSVATGALVQQAAGRNVVPVTLELGGKSPQLVFDDADLDAALPFLVNAGCQNAGQTCSASSRIFKTRMGQAYGELTVGPAAEDLRVGPLISARQKEIVTGFLKKGTDLSIAGQGVIVDHAPAQGAYVCPTLFADVPPDHPLAQEEIFGPVQVLIPFDTEEQAVEIANGTNFGLVAGATARGRCGWPRGCDPARCSSTITARVAGWNCPLAGLENPGTGAKRGLRRYTGFRS